MGGKATEQSQNIFNWDSIKRKKYKTVCSGLAFAKVTYERMVMIFYGISNFCFICCAVGSLQYPKCVWSKVGAPTVHIFISCMLMPQRYQKWKKLPTTFTMFSSSDVFNLDRKVRFKFSKLTSKTKNSFWFQSTNFYPIN